MLVLITRNQDLSTGAALLIDVYHYQNIITSARRYVSVVEACDFEFDRFAWVEN